MGTPPRLVKSPPTAPKAHLQAMESHSILNAPTGPRFSHNEGFTIENTNAAAFRQPRSINVNHSYGSPTTLPPRIRPPRWKTLCRNTVPYDRSYPPRSSYTTASHSCPRGAECLYGHHGDVYLDAIELGYLSFEHGVPYFRDSAGTIVNGLAAGADWSDLRIPSSGNSNETRSHHNPQDSELANNDRSLHVRQGVEPWIERRSEWRKRQAALGPHAENTMNVSRWEDNYKTKEAKRRKGDAGKKIWPKWNDNKNVSVGGSEEHQWGQYTTRRQRAHMDHGKSWQSEWVNSPVTAGQEKQDNLQFEQKLQKLSVDYKRDLQSTPTHQRGHGNSQGMEVDAVDGDPSTSSDETTSTVQFIVPPFPKARKAPQNTPVQSSTKPNIFPERYSYSPNITGIANFSFNPLVSAFSPIYSTSIQNLERIKHVHASTLGPQASREILVPTRALTQLPLASQPPRQNQSYDPTYNSGQWDMYPNYSPKHNAGRGTQQPPAVLMTLDNLNYCIGRDNGFPANVEWKPYAINVRRGGNLSEISDNSNRQLQSAPKQHQLPYRTANTFVVQTDLGPLQKSRSNISPVHSQRYLNHTLTQVSMLLSLYPDDYIKSQVTNALNKLVVPDTLEDMDMQNPSCVPDSLQTALHRLALSISQQEQEIVAEFQAEMWAVLGWLGGGGGNVALIKKGDGPSSADNRSNHGPELGNDGDSAGGSLRKAGIMLSGQITPHHADIKGEVYNEVVALTPGEPAILSPIISPGIIHHSKDWHIPTILLNSPSILNTKSKTMIENNLSFSKEVHQPLPSRLTNEVSTPFSSSSSANAPAPAHGEEGFTQDAINFFLSDKMEAYLQDSYEKVLHVQTAISLKWRLVSKVFEREWSSGISRFARNGIVLRAFSNIHAMVEADWLSEEDHRAYTDIKRGTQEDSDQSASWDSDETAVTGPKAVEKTRERSLTEEAQSIPRAEWNSPNSVIDGATDWESGPFNTEELREKPAPTDTYQGTKGKEKEVYNSASEGRAQIPQRAVWDRRGLCQEVEPVALSNEGRHVIDLVEKMCLKRVMEFEDIDQPSDFLLKLPAPPNAQLLLQKKFEHASSENQYAERLKGSLSIAAENGKRFTVETASGDGVRYKPAEGAQLIQGFSESDDHYLRKNSQLQGRTQESRDLEGSPVDSIRSQLLSYQVFEEESGLHGEEFLTYLVDRLQLQPRLVESPVLNTIWEQSGPLYYTDKPSMDEDTFNTQKHGFDEKVRARLLEMCNLDRSLFMGYIVLEILKIWQEQRRDVTRVKWRYPEVDREALVAERARKTAKKESEVAKLQDNIAQENMVQIMMGRDTMLQEKTAVVQETSPALAAAQPPAPNWADVAKGKKPSIAPVQIAVQIPPPPRTPVSERQIARTETTQVPSANVTTKEKQASAAASTPVSVSKAPTTSQSKQVETTPTKPFKQVASAAQVTTTPSQSLDIFKQQRVPGLLYTEVIKRKIPVTPERLQSPEKVQLPDKVQLPEKVQLPDIIGTALPTVVSTVPPYGFRVRTVSDMDTNGDDTAVWKKYKPKKEKKRHGFDLNDSIEYQKGEIIKIPTPGIAAQSPSKGKQGFEDVLEEDSHLSVRDLPIPPTPHHIGSSKVEADDDCTSQHISIAVSHNVPSVRDIRIEVDQEVAAEEQQIRDWMRRLQLWLWTFNEGVGVDFVEITEEPNYNNGPSEAVGLEDDGATEHGGSEPCVMGNGSETSTRKSRTHRGGSKNRHVLWKREVAERELRERMERSCMWVNEALEGDGGVGRRQEESREAARPPAWV